MANAMKLVKEKEHNDERKTAVKRPRNDKMTSTPRKLPIENG